MELIRLFVFILTALLLSTATANGLSFHMLTTPILTAFFLSWFSALFPTKIRTSIQIMTGGAVIILCTIDCFCQIYFGSPISPQILSNIILSDTREAKEFLSTFIGYRIFTKWRISALLLLALALPFALFRKKKIFIPRKWKKVFSVMLVSCAVAELPSVYTFAKLFLTDDNVEIEEGYIFRHYHEELPTPIHRFAYSYYAAGLSSKTLEAVKKSTFNTSIDSCAYSSTHIVLIIGESYNKHHASLYGYRLPTTPLQEKRQNEGNLFVFHDIVTPWNITSNVFWELFSIWENGATGTLSDYPLFPILFRHAGYEVTFFSNQYLQSGIRGRATNQTGNFFLADMEISDTLFNYRNKKASKFDLGLVKQVAMHKQHRSSLLPTLDIIHLAGQHFEYTSRYPHHLARFSLQDYSHIEQCKEAKEIIMHYDNATFYNDKVLDSLLALYEQDDAIVIFVADHGEEVYDDLPIYGRLFQEPSVQQARQEYEVPMWIWCSDSYKRLHPEIISAIKTSKNKPLTTDRIPQTLLFLAGIKSKWTDDSSNILSANYKPKTRFICGSVDFDMLSSQTSR